jgi:hypothetical protein
MGQEARYLLIAGDPAMEGEWAFKYHLGYKKLQKAEALG